MGQDLMPTIWEGICLTDRQTLSVCWSVLSSINPFLPIAFEIGVLLLRGAENSLFHHATSLKGAEDEHEADADENHIEERVDRPGMGG